MIEQELYAHLVANVPSVDGRVYPLIMPQACPKPALVYTVVNSGKKIGATGCNLGDDVRFQVDVYAMSYAQAKQVKQEVESALFSYDTPRGLNSSDLYEEETELFRQLIDFTFRSKT